MGLHPRGNTLKRSPANPDLAEALFSLSEYEAPGERRLALLKAAYTAFDEAGRVDRKILDEAPSWLRPLISQLLTCAGPGALEAAVGRLAGEYSARTNSTRDDFLSRAEMEDVLKSGPPELSPQRMRGAFHWHTTDSDGKATLESMATFCARRGSSWGVVTDHSRGLEIASGVDREGLRMQRRRLRRWNAERGEDFRLFQGLEVEILEFGDLDISLEERNEVDCVVAAVHSHFGRPRDQTERLLRAINTPGVHVLAHPRARHFHQRPGIKAKWERVFEACAGAGVAVEINGFPRRQDLDQDLTRLAVEHGCMVFLASDAHAPRHLEFEDWACAIAMQAEVPRERILNTRTAECFEDWLNE